MLCHFNGNLLGDGNYFITYIKTSYKFYKIYTKYTLNIILFNKRGGKGFKWR